MVYGRPFLQVCAQISRHQRGLPCLFFKETAALPEFLAPDPVLVVSTALVTTFYVSAASLSLH